MNLKGGIFAEKFLLNLIKKMTNRHWLLVELTSLLPLSMMKRKLKVLGYTITVKGLNGGHSGMDIQGRNAIKL
jgi:hypothetical protein